MDSAHQLAPSRESIRSVNQRGWDRGRLLLLLAGIVLVISAGLPWLQIPSSTESYIDTNGELVLVDSRHWLESVARIAVAAGGIYALFFAVSGHVVTGAQLVCGWIPAALLLAFPAWFSHWNADAVFQSRMQYHEIDRVTWSMEAGFHEQQIDWRTEQSLSEDFPNSFAIYRVFRGVPGWTSLMPRTWDVMVFDVFLGLTHTVRMYCTTFFIGSFAAMAAMLLGLHLRATIPFRRQLRAIGFGVGVSFAVMSIPLMLRITAEFQLGTALAHVRAGADQRALDAYQRSVAWYPVARWDWHSHQSIAKLKQRLESDDSKSSLFDDAYEAVEAGQHRVAAERLRMLLSRAPDDVPVRMWCATALSEAGADAFTSGDFALAQDLWSESLSLSPTLPSAWYGHAMIAFRTRDYEEAVRCHAALLKLQSRLHWRSLTVGSQLRLTQAWAAFHEADLATAHRLYADSLIPGSW